MKKIKKLFLLLLLACFLCGMALPAYAADIDSAVTETAQYLFNTVKTPGIGSVGGEWTVLALARSGYAVPQSYYDGYYSRVRESLVQADGKLSSTKYTEYSRLILALTAIDRDVTDVAGYNLLEKLADFNQVKKQGLTGPVFALLALDCQDYEIPQVAGVAVQTTRQGLIDCILDREITMEGVMGGFSLDGVNPDPDVTGMVLQALAPYTGQDRVKAAIERALQVLASQVSENGTFASGGVENAESLAQVILGYAALGRDPGTEKIDALLRYALNGGSFQHIFSGETDLMATEQSFLALVACQRKNRGQTPIYDMMDLRLLFQDVRSHWAKTEIEAMAKAGFIKGTQEGIFEPERDMTRAEFVAILVRILGLEEVATNDFSDVAAGKWYNGAIGAYAAYTGWDSLMAEGAFFRPEDAVTREEAASFLAKGVKAANLSEAAVRTAISAFTDASDCDTAYRSGMAYCVEKGLILGSSDGKLLPKEHLTRAQAATILSRLLRLSGNE